MNLFKSAHGSAYSRRKLNCLTPPLPPPQGGEVLAAGRARGAGREKLRLLRAHKRNGADARVQGTLCRASPALDPRILPGRSVAGVLAQNQLKTRWQMRIERLLFYES
jgi:hypothetical protein